MKNEKLNPCGCHFEVPRNDGGGRYFVNVVRMPNMLMGRINISQITAGTPAADAFLFTYDLDQAAAIESRALLRIAIGQAIAENLFTHVRRPVISEYRLNIAAAPYGGPLAFVD